MSEELPKPYDVMPPEEKGELLLRYVRRRASVDGLDFSHTRLHDAKLRRADLRGVNLSLCSLEGSDLTGANLREAVLVDAALNGIVLRRATLDDANFSGADIRDGDLSGASMEGVLLDGADLLRADLSNANVRWASWNAVNLMDADLSGVDLTNISFANCCVRGTRVDPRLRVGKLNVAVLRYLWQGEANLDGLSTWPPALRHAVTGDLTGLTLHFSTKLTRVDRLLVDGAIVGVLGRDTDVEVAEFRQEDERTIVRLTGEHQADLELVADALWHRVWDEAAQAQYVQNQAAVGRQINVQGNATFNLAQPQLDDITRRLEALQTLGGSLDALRVQLGQMELRLPTEAANQLLDDEARARQQLELVASWDLTDDPEVALACLLLSLFPDGEGLKRLVSSQVSTTALAPLLPGGNASPAQVAWAAARTMGNAGAVEGVLEGLKAEVPGRAEDIEGVLVKWRER